MRSVTFALFSLGLSLAHVDDECKDWMSWSDDFGWKCKDYARIGICDVEQQAGSPGNSAYEACCHCGGGSKEPEWSRRRMMGRRQLSRDALVRCDRQCSTQLQQCQNELRTMCTRQELSCQTSCRENGFHEECSLAGASSCMICLDGQLTPDQPPTPEPTKEITGEKTGGNGSDEFPWQWLLLLLIPLLCIPLCILLYCMMRPVEQSGTCPPQEIPQDECEEPCDSCTSPMVAGCGDFDPMIPVTRVEYAPPLVSQMVGNDVAAYGGPVGAINQGVQPPMGYGKSGM